MRCSRRRTFDAYRRRLFTTALGEIAEEVLRQIGLSRLLHCLQQEVAKFENFEDVVVKDGQSVAGLSGLVSTRFRRCRRWVLSWKAVELGRLDMYTNMIKRYV